MNQYEFNMINKRTGRAEHARATAKTAEIARAQIVLMYGHQFDVAGAYSDVNRAHYILGEINCADFPAADLAWLTSEAAAVEAA